MRNANVRNDLKLLSTFNLLDQSNHWRSVQWSGRLQELRNKEKVQLGNPKSGRSRLRELFIKFKSQFKWGFAKVVVSRAGRLQEWSQGELRP